MVKTAFLVLALAGCARAESNPYYDWVDGLPELEPVAHESTHTLRVLYLEDPRLEGIPAAQRKRLYKKVSILLKAWYEYDVSIVEVGSGDLLERFNAARDRFASPVGRGFLEQNLIPLGGFGAKDAILATIRKDLAKRDEKIIRRYVKLPARASKRDAVDAVFSIFDDRLSRLRKTRVGKDEAQTLHNREWAETQSFPHWSVFLHFLDEADFVLTNSVIAGPDADMPLYVAIRGGITNGFVTNSDRNPYRAVGVVAAMPIWSDAPFFRKERGKPAGRLDTLATFWMHELGHFFLRMKEHYGEPGCVHVAPESLDVRTWHKDVRRAGNRCRYLPEERLTLY